MSSVLYINYRNYKFEIYLDAERNCLSGKIEGINGEYDSDSISHLNEVLERAVDEEIGYRHQSKLAERNNELAKQVIDLKAEIKKWKKKVIYLNSVVEKVTDNYEEEIES